MCVDDKFLVVNASVNTDIDAFQIDIGAVRVKVFSMETSLLQTWISDDFDVGGSSTRSDVEEPESATEPLLFILLRLDFGW